MAAGGGTFGGQEVGACPCGQTTEEERPAGGGTGKEIAFSDSLGKNFTQLKEKICSCNCNLYILLTKERGKATALPNFALVNVVESHARKSLGPSPLSSCPPAVVLSPPAEEGKVRAEGAFTLHRWAGEKGEDEECAASNGGGGGGAVFSVSLAFAAVGCAVGLRRGWMDGKQLGEGGGGRRGAGEE